jgi:inner membrane protein
MPTIITHGVVALALSAKTRGIRELDRKLLLITCIICSMLPDLDYFGFKMSIQYNSLFGHRGFTHSFFFAAIVALIASWLLHRKAQESLLSFSKLFLLLFVVTSSHALLDAMTDGGEGVAFFSPFSNHRYFFLYRPIMVSPLGIESFFRGWHGLLVLFDEFLLVICPITAALYLPQLLRKARTKKILTGSLLAVWLLSVFMIKSLYPLNNITMTIPDTGRPMIDLISKQYKNPNVLSFIPTSGIPGDKLIKNFAVFQHMGLYNAELAAGDVKDHWASGFFSNWFGGIAGRWQEPNAKLILRTLFGYGVPDSREILEVLKESADSPRKQEFLFKLSPTEKYDLAMGDYNFTSTRAIGVSSHNAGELPKFWFGICNGMAAASKWYLEPFRSVEVINPNGFKILFHPGDVKALLGFAMAEASQWTEIGTRCTINGPDANSCRINPGAFFLAVMNRLGLAHDSFIADGFSGTRKQFYLFDAARVEILKPPRPVVEMKEWAAPTSVKSIAEVRFTLEFVSTLLSDKAGSAPDAAKGDSYYQKVGRVVVPRVLDAMIALNQNGEVVGGGWLGENDVPDVVFFPSSIPGMDEQSRLRSNNSLNWNVIRQLYYESINGAEKRQPVDFSL